METAHDQSIQSRRRYRHRFGDDAEVSVPQEVDDRLSARAISASRALSRRARTAQVRRWDGALHRLRAVRGRVSRQRDHGHRRRERSEEAGVAGRALRLSVRDRHAALHLLRLVRRGVPDRCDRADAALRHRRLHAPAARVRQRQARGARSVHAASCQHRIRRRNRSRRGRGQRRSGGARSAGVAMTVLFWICALVAIATGIWTISSRQPVHSVVGLIVNFAALAVLFLTLNADFLAMMQIIIYAGAILVLFLFVIALLTIGADPIERTANRLPEQAGQAVIAGLVALGFIGWGIRADWTPAAAKPAPDLGTVGTFGVQLLTTHVFAFEATGFVLLVAIIGVVMMAGRRETGARS